MNKQTKAELRRSMSELLFSKQPWIRINAGLILCAIDNAYVGECATATIDAGGKLHAQLAIAKQEVLTRLLEQQDRKKQCNRRFYLRQKLRTMKQKQQQETNDKTPKDN